MYGREVGNIVEKAAEEDVVAKGVYWSGVFFFTLSVSPKRKFETERKKRERGGNSRGDDKKDLTGNKNSQIMDTLGLNRDLSHGKPHSEE